MWNDSMQVWYTDKAKTHFESNAYKNAIHALLLEHNSNRDCDYYMRCERKLTISNTTIEDYHKLVSPMLLQDATKRKAFMSALWLVLIECYWLKPYELDNDETKDRYGVSEQNRAIIQKYVNKRLYTPNYNNDDPDNPSATIEELKSQNIVDIPDHVVKNELDAILQHGAKIMKDVEDWGKKALQSNIENPHTEVSQYKIEADEIEKEKEKDIENERKKLV